MCFARRTYLFAGTQEAPVKTNPAPSHVVIMGKERTIVNGVLHLDWKECVRDGWANIDVLHCAKGNNRREYLAGDRGK